MLFNKACLENCPDTYYNSYDEQLCFRCDEGCANCFAAGNSSCTSCKSGLLLSNSICVSACPNKTYQVDAYNCKNCNYKCNKCFGPEAGNCTECLSKYFLLKTFCLEKCEAGFYMDPQTKICD